MELLLFITVVLLIWFAKIYNQLQRFGNDVKRARADIMASLKKRLDLAGRLVDITQSYGEHEKFTQLTTAENMSSITDAMVAARKVDQVLNQVSSLAMAYPDLKANATYQQLMSQLHDIESDLQKRREGYNASVSHYNAYRSSLPQTLFASSVGFHEAPFYSVDEAGLEALPDFKTDDGQMLKATLQKMGDKASGLVNQAGKQLNTALAEVKGGQEGQGRQ
ncbi:LemA family protein [Magnetospirillum sp. LM-5]|uniref:LemA family protein n=1 Tax=Magnetospirillum sp. LM-5 TaxID=2681466 RepID=UPI00137F0DF2|nr:LemA family protein [Magnetospirillum sp. LM-5]CAA7616495.1 LemA family protein [Magnetospirillum sp. LM-5]